MMTAKLDKPAAGKGEPTLRYALALGLACLFGILLVSSPILANGRGIVWSTDALPLYINSLMQIGIMFRRTLRGLLAGDGLLIQQFVPNLEYGVDVTSVCQLFDPLNWTAVFVPAAGAEYLYYALIVVRVFLAAFCFSLYGFARGNGRGAVFVGSLIYAFSGYALFWAVLRHPNFLNASYALPLVLLGADRLLNGGKPTVFVFALALSFALSPYFTYMIALFVVLYCLVMFFCSGSVRTQRAFFAMFARFLASAIAALGISAVAAAPAIIGIASLDRVGVDNAVPPLHQLTYYMGLVSNYLGGGTGLDSGHHYVGAVALLLVLLFLLLGRKLAPGERRVWLVLLASVFVCSLVPYLEHAIHGFSYVTDRWLFAFDFVVAYVATMAMPLLKGLPSRSWRKLAALCLACGLLALLPLCWEANAVPVAASEALLAAVVGAVAAARKDPVGGRVLPAFLSAAVLAGAFLASFSVCAPAPFGGNYQSQFLNPAGTAHSFFSDASPYAVASKIPGEQKSMTRYSMPGVPGTAYLNASLTKKTSGLTSYTSSYNQHVDDFRDELGISDYFTSNKAAGSDSRLAVDAFSGARYFVAAEGDQWRVPATYAYTGKSRNGYRLYETDYAAPMAFVMDKVIGRQTYGAMGMVEKQEAILQSVVLKDAPAEGPQGTSPAELSSKSLSYDAQCDSGISFEGNRITVADTGAAVRLSFDGLPDSETYVCFENLRLAEWTPPPLPEQPTLAQRIRGAGWAQPSAFSVSFASELGSSSRSVATPSNVQYCGKVDWAFNCGYSRDAIGGVSLSFGVAGVYEFDSLEVVCQPVGPLKASLKSLQSRAIDDVSWSKSRSALTATADAEGESEYAVFTTAYSPGWSAKVDGEPAEVLAADTGFIAVALEGPGTHTINLEYKTPGLLPGAAVTLMSLVAFAVYLVYTGRKAPLRPEIPGDRS